MSLFQKEISLGLYITPAEIEVVELSHAKGRLTIKKAIRIPTPPRAIDENGRITDPRPIGLALSELIKSNNIQRKKTRIALWGVGIFAHLIKLPPLERDEMREALISEAERYAVFAESEPVVDFEVLTQTYIGPAQQTVDVLFMAAQREMILSYHEILKLAKLPLAGFDYAPFSILRANYSLDNIKTALEGEELWGNIAVTPRRAALSIWQGALLKFYREIDIPSAKDVQGEISNVNFTHLDLAISKEELFTDLKNSLDYFSSMSPENHLTALYLAMEASEEKYRKAWAAELTQSLGVRVNSLPALTFQEKGEEIGVSAIAFGAGSSAWAMFPRVFDLVHPELKPVELTREFKLLVAANIVFIVLAGIYYVSATQIIQTKKKEIAVNKQIIAALQVKVSDPNLNLKVNLLAEIEKLTRYPIDELFGQAQQRIPQDTWINTLTIKSDGKFSLTGGTLADRSPLEYGRNLVQVPEVSGLELVNVSEVKGKTASYYVYGFTGKLKSKKF